MTQFIAAGMVDQDGATAIEYGLIAGGIALVIVATVYAVGTNLATFFGNLAGAF